ncbi:MAG: hypothetical protein ACTSSG_10240 [Candidatus Heimdallarchaeaceae archaeon]
MSHTTEMLEKIYQAIIMLRGDIDLLKAKLIPEAMPTEEERKAIKELEEEIEAGEWESWEDVKKELD